MSTPRTIDEAIKNGLEISRQNQWKTDSQIADEVRRHVKDFLAQKFQIFMTGRGDESDKTAQKLWYKIGG